MCERRMTMWERITTCESAYRESNPLNESFPEDDKRCFWQKITENAVSHPSNPLRYRYFVVLVIIIIVVLLTDKRARHLHLEQIDFKGLVAYLILVIILFCVAMRFEGRDHGLSSNQWDLLHFTFYFFLAFFMPDNWPIVFTLQVAWELFEDYMGYDRCDPRYIETDQKKMFDILANNAGYFVGNKLFANGVIRAKVIASFNKLFYGTKDTKSKVASSVRYARRRTPL